MRSLPTWRTLLRPQLLAEPPLLWVGPEAVQWADDPVPIPVTADHLSWVGRLDGTRTLSAVLAAAPAPVETAHALLAAAYRTGYLADSSAVPARWFWGDDLDRTTTLRLTRVLLAEHRGALSLTQVNRLVDLRGRVHVRLHDPHSHLPELADAVRTRGMHTAPAEALGAEPITVLVSCGHPDVMHDDHADIRDAGDDTPYLHIGLAADTAVVGPLVIPRETSCLRCAHLHRRDRDPTWALRSVQWAHHHARVCRLESGALRWWVTHAAATLLTAWSDARGAPATEPWREIAYRIGPHALRPEREERPRHPLCGCGWSDPG